MAQLLQHQESAFYGKELHSCRWRILQFFGFRRRLRSTKMLSDKKHGHGKGSGGSRRRSSYTPLRDEDSGIIDEKKNDEVTKKQKASKKNSGKASLRSLISRKLYGKEGQKEKMLPVAPKLLRTISIHYLESNEYVLDGEATSSIDGSSHGSIPSTQDTTNTGLQHATSDTVGDRDNNISYLLSLKSDNSHVKRKSHRSISMDGVLHKVPYGKKVSDDIINEVLPRSASATYDRDGPKSYIGVAAKRHANQGFRRSRSLSESLEDYSRLLDSIASRDSKKILTSSKSTRDRSLDGPSALSSLPRTSNAEFRSQGWTRHGETLEDALTPHGNDAEETNAHVDKEVVVDERSNDEISGDSGKFFLPEQCISDKSCDVAVSTEAHSCTDPSTSEVIEISKYQAAACDDNDQSCSPIEIDLCDARSTPKEVNSLEQHAAICDDGETQPSMQSDSCIAPSPDATTAEEYTTYSHDNQTHSFQNSKPIEDTFPKARILQFNDTDVPTGIGAVQENISSGDDVTGLQVDPRHEAEFTYVTQIFNKSSFSTETLYDEWCSQNITALQEDDCQHYEAAAAAFDFTDMSAEQLLLFDLTNEALLDIHKKRSVCESGLSSFSRAKPVGRVGRRELWAELSRQLDEQPRSAVEVDAVLARDLDRSKQWTKFQRDGGKLRDDLGDFVLGRLVSELVLELAEF